MMVSKLLRPWPVVAALLLAFVVVLTGCSSDSDSDDESAGETRTVNSVDGPVEIPAAPKRIVALRGAAEALLVLDGPVVGVPEGATYTQETFGDNIEAWERYQGTPKIGGDVQPDYEKILAAEPDLIIGGVPPQFWDKVDKERLSAIAPVVNIDLQNAVAGWKNVWAQTADIAGLTDAEAAKKAEYDERAQQVHDKHAAKIDGKKFVAIATWGEGSFWNQTSGSYIAHKPEDAGLVFPGGDPEELSLELLANFGDYDGIVIPVEPDGTMTPEMRSLVDSELFKSLPAVQAGRVIAISHTDPFSYDSGLVCLDDLDAQLAKLPA